MPAVPYDPLRLPEYQIDQYVVPVLSAASDGNTALHGTAFFINSDGVFLTAGHVIDAARSAAAQRGGKIWLSVRIPDSDAGAYHEILSTELAPAPFDVAIGKVSTASQSFVRLADMSAGAPLRNVWTFGYPESAHARASSGHLLVGHRAHKGYIIRRLRGDELAFPFAPGFELNFPIPSALSGAPLVLERPATALEHALMAAPGMIPMIGMGLVDVRFMPKHALHLIGVCVGTTQAETVAFSHTEVIDGNTKISEKTSKIELYGIAHDLLPLTGWKPLCLGGVTLAQAIEPT
jgi:hypothetical protein